MSRGKGRVWLSGVPFAGGGKPSPPSTSFPLILVRVVAREIVAGSNWRNLPMIGAVVVLAIANLLMHLETVGAAAWPTGFGWRFALAAVKLLMLASWAAA